MPESRFSRQNVSVACDISLGPLFRDSPWTEIQIDPDAIADIVIHHNPDMPAHEVLVIAGSYDSLEQVHRGGASFTRSADEVPAGITEFVYATRQAKAHIAVYDNSPLGLDYSKHTTLPSDYMQETAVHELKHVADYPIDGLLAADLRYIALSTAKTLAKVGLVVSGALELSRHSIKAKTETKRKVTAWAGSRLLSRTIGVIKNAIDTYDYESPLEVRALQAEKEAATLPTVITLK